MHRYTRPGVSWGLLLLGCLLAGLWIFTVFQAQASPPVHLVYGDALAAGWSDRSWGINVDFASAEQTQSGSSAIRAEYRKAYGNLFLESGTAITASDYETLQFWLHGGSQGGQPIAVTLADEAGNKISSPVQVTTSTGVWQLVEIPLADLAASDQITGIFWQEDSGQRTGRAFYIDEVRLVAGAVQATATQPAATVPPPTATSSSIGGGSVAIYADGLAAGWSDWSWGTTANFANANPVQAGAASMAVTYNQGWSGLYLHTGNNLSGADVDRLAFWIHGGAGGAEIQVALADGSATIVNSHVNYTAQAGGWSYVEIPVVELGSPAQISGVVWQDATGSAQPTFYIDEAALMGDAVPTSVPSPTATATPLPSPTSASQPTATPTPPSTATAPAPTPTSPPSGGSTVAVFEDALASGWSNWSWGTTANFANGNPVHAGSDSIAVSYTQAWGGLYLHTNDLLSGANTESIGFWIHGGTSGAQVQVALADGAASIVGSPVGLMAPAGSWSYAEIAIGDLGSPAQISGVVWQEATGAAQPTFYLDDVTFIQGAPPSPPPPSTGPVLSVDASTTEGQISPYIYGMNFADETFAGELDLPVNRWGGNATTRYNWQLSTSNRASDWYFENIPSDLADPNQLPFGSSSDQFVQQNLQTGTDTLLTVPLIGWTPKDREIRCGFSVSLYGNQQEVDPWRPDCGNGVRTDGSMISGNNPADTSIQIGPSFVSDWIAHLTGQFGNASGNGVRFYNLDNEPMLWNSTHRDVHPEPVGYDEARDRAYQYGAAVKAADPTAQTLGPVVWGWTAYFYSALDAAGGGNWWNNPPDRNAHGGVPFVPWYLGEMQAYEQQHGVRILDYLDLHYYPQAAGVALSSAGNSETQALRLRSTKALWDSSYSDESWIGEPVRLIPRMREWVDQYYPGTKLAITEYNWGGMEHINGALAQADVLGIFGREGLDLATIWARPAPDEPGAFAFRMYRNYDGQGNKFGDLRVAASSSNQDQLSVYAAKRSNDGKLTVVVINKTAGTLTADVALSGLSGATTAEVYRYSEQNLSTIERLQDQAVGSSGFSATFAPNSITLFVLDL